MSIVDPRISDIEFHLHGTFASMRPLYAMQGDLSPTGDALALGQKLAVAALDDENSFHVFCDWFIENIRPDWADNVNFHTEWVRRLLEEQFCRSIVMTRSGECPVVVGGLSANGYWTVESWRGRVCELSSKSERIMSDVWAQCFYAHVLTLDGQIRTFCYANDEFGGAQAGIDASPELLNEYRRKVEERDARLAVERAELARKQEEERQAREAATPRRGKTVKVVRGRKVPIGTVGIVNWYGETQYGFRVGIDVKGERLWTAATNVEVIQSEDA